MTNPIGSGILAALALTSVTLAGGNDDNKNTPPSSPQGGVTAAPGKGITFQGENFTLNLMNRIQVNLGFAANDGTAEDTLGVMIRRARTKLSGDAYKDTVHFLLQMEWADNDVSDILDGLIMWDFMKSDDMTTTLRFGQGKSLYGREWSGSSASLEFIDRAIATQVMSGVRSRQAQVTGKMAGGKFRWNAGMLNNDVAGASIANLGDDANNGSNELNWVAGMSYGTGQDELYGEHYKQGALKPSEELMWVGSVALGYGQNDRAEVGAEFDAFNVTGGVTVVSGHIHVLAEVFLRDESVDQGAGTEKEAFGWQAQGSYTADPGPTVQWGGGIRASGVHVTDQTVVLGGAPVLFNPGFAGEGDIIEFQVVLSGYYHGHSLKTQVGYTLQQFEPDVGTDATNHVIELQSQIVF